MLYYSMCFLFAQGTALVPQQHKALTNSEENGYVAGKYQTSPAYRVALLGTCKVARSSPC